MANPKDLLARRENKVNLALVPPVAEEALARAMMNGAAKYGPWNWRSVDSGVDASVYVAACKRHLAAWFQGEERASDSGVHHLGHAMACLAILLDAQANGCLHDDRPPAYLEIIDPLAYAIREEPAGANAARRLHEQERTKAVQKWMDDHPYGVPSE